MKFILSLSIFLAFAVNAWTQTTKIVEKEQLIRSEEVYFDFGKYDIRADADSTLLGVLNFCVEKQKLTLNITAHTDAIGSNTNNLTLSQNRANAVKDYLVNGGLVVDSIATSVFGEEKPVAENNSETGRQRNRRASIDIYQTMKLFSLEGTITDKETGKGIETDVFIKSKNLRDSIRTDTTGKWSSLVPLGAVVGLEVYAKGYFLESKMMKVIPSQIPDLNVRLAPVRVGEIVDIDNLYFEGNKAVLVPSSKPELPKILRFMQVNYCAKIEIAGHVNFPNRPPVTEQTFEYQLSVRRAKLVHDFLITNGIAEDRVTFKGYGNWEMRYPEARTQAHQAQNRRVEIRVLETSWDKR